MTCLLILGLLKFIADIAQLFAIHFNSTIQPNLVPPMLDCQTRFWKTPDVNFPKMTQVLSSETNS